MFKAFSIAALAASVMAADNYQVMEDVMAKHGFTWEPIKVTTDDGFILTTFHVTGNRKGPFKPNKPPLLIQHGDMDDGANWMTYYPEGLPLQL